MTLADKRKVIEVLLCNAQCIDGPPFETTWHTAELFGFGATDHRSEEADRAWRHVTLESGGYFRCHHSNSSLEAAYRLIESSPTLRREWFGAK